MTKGIENKIREMVFRLKKPKIAEITKERLEAMIGKESPCLSCWKYIFRNPKPGHSQISFCCLGLDTTDRVACSEWQQTRDHGLIAEAILDEGKQRITKQNYLDSLKG